MRLTRVPFTIRSLIIAVLVFACPLALPTGWLLILIGLAAPCLALFGLPWLVLGANRRRTMFDFCVSAAFINVLFAAYCIAPDINLRIPLMLRCLVIVGPAIGLLGAACATLSTQEGAVWRRFIRWACLPVIALSILPLVTVLSCWPLRLGLLLFQANPGTPGRPGRRRAVPQASPTGRFVPCGWLGRGHRDGQCRPADRSGPVSAHRIRPIGSRYKPGTTRAPDRRGRLGRTA